MLFPTLVFGFAAAVSAQGPHQQCKAEVPETGGGKLKPIRTARTANGFDDAPRGWNSWGIQPNPRAVPESPASIAPYTTQDFIESQCGAMADDRDLRAAGYNLCSIDGGWESSVTDRHGRITWNTTRYDLKEFGRFVRKKDLLFGIYSDPLVPCEAGEKNIKGTRTKIRTIFTNKEDPASGKCSLDYDNPDTQLYIDSLIELWASWGVDMIKLDYITPGSLIQDKPILPDTSGHTVAYHKAIEKSGRRIRLDISSTVCRNETYLPIWEGSSDTMRLSLDLNHENSDTLVGLMKVQATIDHYRQYVNQLIHEDKPLRLRPDFDNLFVANDASITGVNDRQRTMMMSHWIGAAANLILGSDMTRLDDHGKKLLTSKKAMAAADFCGEWPMQPRNPGTGSSAAKQLQGWVCGPNKKGEAYVLLANYGPNMSRGGYDTRDSGDLTVTISLEHLGLTGRKYVATDVWGDNGYVVKRGDSLSALLAEGSVEFLRLKPVR